MSAPQASNLPDPTRRAFLKAAGAVAAGMNLTAASHAAEERGSVEALAVSGGPKAVSEPDADAFRWPVFGSAEEEAVLSLVRKPSYDPIAALEKEWREYFGVEYATALCNGTSALAAMYFALDLPAGSEILVPSYTFLASIMPMRLFGLVPVFVEINPRTLNIDLEDAKKRVTKNTRAILPVHWFGLPCDMDAITDWAKAKDLIVLEDAAQSHGAKVKGKWVGNWGRMSIFSFHGSKPLPAIEGGIAVFRDREDSDRGTALGNFDRCRGKYAKYRDTGLGMKSRMHPMAAALARCQLQALAANNALITAQTKRLNQRLVALAGLSEPQCRPDSERVYYSQNLLFLDEAKAGMSRKKCIDALRAEGVRASVYNYKLQHQQPIYTEAQWWHHLPEIPKLPATEAANATTIAVPLMTSEQPALVEQYARAFEKVWAHRRELS